MYSFKRLVSIGLLSVASSTVLAAPYAGISYLKGSSEGDGVDVDTPSVNFRVGNKINEYAALEVRAGTGAGDDSFDDFGPEIDVELDYLYGAYLLAGIPNDTPIFPYLVVGYTKAEYEFSGNGVSTDDNESDVSYGFGADFDFAENLLINGEYIQYVDKNGLDFSGVSLGLSYLF